MANGKTPLTPVMSSICLQSISICKCFGLHWIVLYMDSPFEYILKSQRLSLHQH